MGANIAGECLGRATLRGFTKEQLYSASSYQQESLPEIGLNDNDLTGWNLGAIDRTRANLEASILTGAELSTQTSPSANLRSSSLADAKLSGAKVTGADLGSSPLTRADLSGANLRNVAPIRCDRTHVRPVLTWVGLQPVDPIPSGLFTRRGGTDLQSFFFRGSGCE